VGRVTWTPNSEDIRCPDNALKGVGSQLQQQRCEDHVHPCATPFSGWGVGVTTSWYWFSGRRQRCEDHVHPRETPFSGWGVGVTNSWYWILGEG